MDIVTTVCLAAVASLVLLGFALFGLVSRWESERRAARVSFAAAASSLALYAPILLPPEGRLIVLGVMAVAAMCGVLLFYLPVGQVERGNDVPLHRYDERDIMFARARLAPESPEYETYYEMHPEHRSNDERTRRLPGLLSQTSKRADPAAFASAMASFSLVDVMRSAVDGPVAPTRLQALPEQMATYIKGAARYYGAYTVGICELEPYHVYSHVGRGPGEWGAPIAVEHRYAIAFTVEMDHSIMGSAPNAPVVMESARQYVEAGKVALELGYLIRSMGYPARAHVDGNYRVVAPLVARDAGLGEIGRMGLLMTPELGPRVRLGVVTTDLPLVTDGRREWTSVLDFCRICVKCATACPSQSIPRGDREEIDGALRWRIDSDGCFRYWNTIGTDCGRCMAVCPYSHPDNAAHNLVRWAARRSGLARRAVLWMDNLFYGRDPASRPGPDWIAHG
jgi:ferredoxin